MRRASTPDMSEEAVDVGRCTKRITNRIISAEASRPNLQDRIVKTRVNFAFLKEIQLEASLSPSFCCSASPGKFRPPGIRLCHRIH
jgi:hypothetical protein